MSEGFTILTVDVPEPEKVEITISGMATTELVEEVISQFVMGQPTY